MGEFDDLIPVAPATGPAVETDPFADLIPPPGRAKTALGQVGRGFLDTLGSVLRGTAITAETSPIMTGPMWSPPNEAFQKLSRDRMARTPTQIAADIEASPGTGAAKSVEALSESIPVNPEFAKEFWVGKVPSAIGSTAAFLPAAPAGGPLGMGVLGAFAGLGSGYREAIEAGAKPEDALANAAWNAAVGTTEAIPLSRLLNRLDKASGGGIKKALVDMVKQGFEEGAQETFQQAVNNAAAKFGYDKDRKLLDSMGENGAVGFVVGALFAGGGHALKRAATGREKPEAPPLPTMTAKQIRQEWLARFPGFDTKQGSGEQAFEAGMRGGEDALVKKIVGETAEQGKPVSPAKAYSKAIKGEEEAQPEGFSIPSQFTPAALPTPIPPIQKDRAQVRKLSVAGARILMKRGVDPETANRFATLFTRTSQHDAVGEQFRSDLNRAFDESGLLDRQANTYSPEANLRAAAEANNFSEEDIQLGIQKHAERAAEIEAHNRALIERIAPTPKGSPDAIRQRKSTPIPVGQGAQGGPPMGQEVRNAPQPPETRSVEVKAPPTPIPTEVTLKPGDEAPIEFASVQEGMPKMGWYRVTAPFKAPDGATYKPGSMVNTGQVEDVFGYKIPAPAKAAFLQAGGVERQVIPSEEKGQGQTQGLQVTAPKPEGGVTPPVPPAEPAAPTAKEPWQMTKAEWIEYTRTKLEPENVKLRAQGFQGVVPNENAHYYTVKNALLKGKPVPPEVLAEYPDLVKSVAEKPATPASPKNDFQSPKPWFPSATRENVIAAIRKVFGGWKELTLEDPAFAKELDVLARKIGYRKSDRRFIDERDFLHRVLTDTGLKERSTQENSQGMWLPTNTNDAALLRSIKDVISPTPEPSIPPAAPVEKLRPLTAIEQDLAVAQVALNNAQQKLLGYQRNVQGKSGTSIPTWRKAIKALSEEMPGLQKRVDDLKAEQKAKQAELDAIALERRKTGANVRVTRPGEGKAAKAEAQINAELEAIVNSLRSYSGTRNKQVLTRELKPGDTFEVNGQTVTVKDAQFDDQGRTVQATLKLDDGTMFGKEYTIRPMEESGPGAVPEVLWSKRVVKAPEAPLQGIRPEEFTEEERNIANATSRAGGAIGGKAITPKWVIGTAKPDETILDFGSGNKALHTLAMRELGLNVVAHEFGDNVKEVHDPNALGRQYDTVFASNVLNVQSSESMLRRTLSQISNAVSANGRAVFNFPKSPRKSNITANRLREIVGEYFGEIERVGGTESEPLIEARRPIRIDQQINEGREGFTRVIPNPLTDAEIRAHLKSRHGIAPDNKTVEIVDRPESEALGQYNPQTGKIEINRARIADTRDIDWVWDHERAHLFDVENPGAVAALRKSVTAAEWTKIVNDVRRAGYAASVQVREQDARVVQTLADAWRGRGWFDKLVKTVQAWAGKKGIEMDRVRAERAAVRALAEATNSVQDEKWQAKVSTTETPLQASGDKYPTESIAGEMERRGWKIHLPRTDKGKPDPEALTIGADRYPTLKSPDGSVRIAVDATEIFERKGSVWYGSQQEWKPDRLTLSAIVTSPESRGTGKASAAMRELLAAADAIGMRLLLEPARMKEYAKPGQKSLSTEELADWYKRLGFEQQVAGSNKVLERKPQTPTAEPPLEARRSGEEQPEMRPTQVAGEKIGSFQVREKLEPIRARARLIFSGQDEVNPLNTENWWTQYRLLTDPALKGSEAAAVSAAIGGQGMGLGLFRNELWDYAVKAAVRGDTSMVRRMVQESQNFPTINIEDTGLGDTLAGRVLRAAAERRNNEYWQSLVILAKASQEAVEGELKLKPGPEGMEQILAEIETLVARTTQDVDAFEKQIRTGDLKDLLERLGPERRQADDIVNGQAFIPPEGRNSIRETVYEWLKSPQQDGTEFVRSLKAELITDRPGRARLNDEQAQIIADQTWNRKAKSVSERTKRLLDAELNRLDRLPTRTVEEFMARVSAAEWKRPESPNNVRQILKRYLRWRPEQGENARPIDAQEKEFKADLTAELVREGVSEDLAEEVAKQVFQKRTNDWSVANTKAMERAAESTNLKSLIESIQQSPYLAQNNPEWRKATARRWFESNGITGEAATQAVKMFEKQFLAAMEAAARKVSERYLSRTVQPRTIDEVVAAIRAGLTDPNKYWVDEIAKKKGFKPLTTQEHEWLAQLESQYSRPDISAHEKVALAEQMMGILRHSGLSRGHVMKVLGESFAASLLSGIRTTTLNVLQPWTTMAVNLATHAAFQPKDFPMLMKSMVDSAKMWWPEFRFAFSRDAYEMASSERVFHSNHLKRVFEQAQMDWRKAKRSGDPKLYSKAFLEFAYGWQQYVVRALAAADQAGMAVARDWKMALYGSMAMREAGFSTKDISRIVDVVREGKEAAFQDALAQGYGKNDADVIANEKAREALRQWFANDSRLGLEKTVAVEEAAVYDAFSIVGRRAPHVSESEEGFLSRYLGVNWVMRRATEARMEGGGASIMTIMAVGFMNVPLRTARYYAGFGPYGLIRAGINKYRTSRGKEGEGLLNYWEQSYHNSLMSKARLREAMVGTALAFGFFGWQSYNSTSDDDAEKKEFALYVTGMGPANRTLRDAWQKRGFQPFTLHIVAGNKVVSQIPITRAGQIFGFPLGFAAAVDDLAWRRKQEAATGKAHQEFGGRELAAIAGTYYQIAGAQGVFQAAGRLSQIGQGDVGLGRFVGMQTASLASGLLPGKSLIQGLADITYGPVDRSSIEAAMAANFPVLGAFVSGKAINRLGDPIGEGTWEAKLARMGFPVVFRLSDNKENKAIYQLLLDKGAAPPDLRRYVIEDAYGPLNQDQWSRFVAASGGHLKRLISDNLAGLQTMQPQDVKSFMNRAGQMANNQAGIDIGLQRQAGGGGYSSAGTGGGGGLSGSAAPAIPKAPRVSLPGGRASVSVGAAPRIGAGLRRVGYGRRFGIGRGLGAGRFHRGRKRLLRSKRFVSGRVRIPRSRFSRRIRFSRRPRLASFA